MRLIFILLLLCTSLAAQSGSIVLTAPAASEVASSDARSPLFAAPIALAINPGSAGKWVRNNGINGRLELSCSLPNAHGLGLYLDQLRLPAGSRVWLTAEVGNQKLSTPPIEAAQISTSQRLFTGFLPVDRVTLVYEGTVFSEDQPAFRIWRADYVTRPDIYNPQKVIQGFGNSNSCQVNANCPAGEGWSEEKSSAARIIVIVAEGAGYCSGTLMNNTAADGRPLFLTGFHCQDGYTPLYDLWRFDFGYRAEGCGNPEAEPNFTAYSGAILRAGARDNDFLLLELSDPAFDATTHYFAGWDRSDGSVTGNLLTFHHPMGDIQKMGRSNGMNILTGPITWGETLVTPGGYHFRMVYNLGSFQVGASGSSVYDSNRRVRGYLSGGNANCPGTTEAFIGRLFQAWIGGGAATSRLSDWLDPLGLEPMTLDGQRLQGNTGGRLLSGQALYEGSPVANVRLIFNWGSQLDTVYTDALGKYSLPRPNNATSLGIATNYEFGSEFAGVNVIDIVAIRRHILALDTLESIQLLAGDVTNDGQVTIGDIVRISQVILGLRSWEFRPNWLVFPSLLPIDPLPTNAFGPFGIQINNPNVGIITLDFEVVKNGDVNFDGR